MKKYNLGVIGVHIRARHSLENLFAEIEGVNVVSVAQYDEVSPVLLENWTEKDTRKYAGELNAEYCENWKTIVEDTEIDMVSVMVPPDAALKVVKECVKNNKHVILDKPPFMDPKEARNIFREAQKKGLKFFFQYGVRRLPAFEKAIEAAESGEIGKILAVNIDMIVGNGPLAGFTAS